MARTWTSTELLADTRAQARLADDDPDATDALLLAEANRQLDQIFVPLVRKARSEFYQQYRDVWMVAGQRRYPIPARATTGSVRGVYIRDQTGRERPLNEITYEEMRARAGTSGNPTHYAIADDCVYLYPTPVTSGSAITSDYLRITYEYRPSTLVLTTAARAITAYSTSTLVGVPVYHITAETGVFADGSYVDVVRSTPPFSIPILDGIVESETAGVYVVSCGLGEDALLNYDINDDWLCNAGESPIPQLPAELHPWLALATAASFLAPIDQALAASMNARLAVGLEDARQLLAKRKQGTQMKMRPKSSLMRRNGRTLRRGGTFDDWNG